MAITSQSLLERLSDRTDVQSWQRLLAIYEPWLRGWLSRQGLQPADAEDILQDVLVVVSEQIPGFTHNGRPGAFRVWLKAILSNRVRHFLRSRRTREGLVAPQPPADWVEQFIDDSSALSRQWDEEHDQHLVRRMLASIQAEFNETTWRVFRMLVLEDCPPAEVARQLDITPNAVYVAKARVLARLRSELRGLMELA